MQSTDALRLAAAFTLLTLVAPAAFALPGKSVMLESNPTLAQITALQNALGKDYADLSPFNVGLADLNGDGHPDLLARSDSAGWCGSLGCSTYALLATGHGYSSHAIQLAKAYGPIEILPQTTDGMHALRFDDGDHIFRWSGKVYR